jgi:hypothetical protein
MAVDKKISYINQDGYKNYIKNSDSITIPKKFKARKKAASTHLAYITKAEAAQLKKQNKGTPHKGPKGIPSYDDYDASAGRYGRATSGQTMSGIESGNKGETGAGGRADTRALGYNPQEVADIRGGAQAAARMGQRRSGIGGLLGGIGRGLLGFFGGIPGKVMSGIMSAKNWAKQKGTGAWEGVQDFGEGVKEFSEHDDLMSYLNRDKIQAIQPVKTIDIKEKFDRAAADGGRIGLYAGGDPEEPAEDIREIMRGENIPFSDQVEGEEGILEQLIAQYIEAGFPPDQAEAMAMQELQAMSQGSEQGIASLV